MGEVGKDGGKTAAPSRFEGFVPQRAAIDAYGNGGFRFAGMSHRGSLLALADGMHAWPVGAMMAAADFEVPLRAVLERLEEPQFLLLGTGTKQIFPDARLRAVFLERHIGFDVMDTGAAARTYNVLLAEGRPVMAALVAVG
jgi:uncharacterized protein